MTPATHALRFDNAFVRELPGDPGAGTSSATNSATRPRQVFDALYSRVTPTPVAAPSLLAHSPEVASLLGLDADVIATPKFAQVFGGNALWEGMQPYAANYGGHQFGQWAGQLGDGRAISLGEVVTAAGARWELQLKGAGPTPYSRRADGRAVLRSSIREFLCSEAMHHLGVPTTRALSLVATGDAVVRDMFYDGHPKAEPGAIVCRVAPSFIRFGSFELPASRGELALLDRLVHFTIHRDFPELLSAGSGPADADVRAEWFGQVCERTAEMVAHWMRVGFVHGVMNTDNMSILGLTIDYGPYGWVDNLDPGWTPNTTDAGGRRYRFGAQAEIAHWNLGRLARALMPLFESTEPLQAGLDRYVARFDSASRRHVAAKLGLAECRAEDVELMEALLRLLHDGEVDMTIFFRALADVTLPSTAPPSPPPSALSATTPEAPTLGPLREAFYDPVAMARTEPAFIAWLARYAARVAQEPAAPAERRARMHAANPKYVLRNYLAQQAIDSAEQGDMAGVRALLDVLRRPYEDQVGAEPYAQRRPDWARNRAGCSMLSCSS